MDIKYLKGICLVLTVVIVAVSGKAFYDHRHFQEEVVLGPGITTVKRLSDYFGPLAGSTADANIYILDSGRPGGTAMIIGRSHPEEPAGNLAAQVIVENAVPTAGRLVVVISANRSSSTVTRPGEGYPMYYEIPTDWGKKTFRMGCRWANPLDSWPDPEVYVHYPSGQMLAYMDIRNQNRTWPGRPDGLLMEQVNYAYCQVIEQEEVDLFIDLHEAELEYSVNNTIVAHERGRDIAVMASMFLTSDEFQLPLGMEYSPPALCGLSHREVGDHTRAISLLIEVAEPMLDRIRGITDEKLLLEGNDPFVKRAGQLGLLYVGIPEEGWHIDRRVGRHLSTVLEIFNQWNFVNFDKPIEMDGVPRLADVLASGLGHYFHNPREFPEARIRYE